MDRDARLLSERKAQCKYAVAPIAPALPLFLAIVLPFSPVGDKCPIHSVSIFHPREGHCGRGTDSHRAMCLVPAHIKINQETASASTRLVETSASNL